MKVLYITHQYFPYFYTGTELLTDNLSRYMRKLGVDTKVWACNLQNKNIYKIEETNYKDIPVVFFAHHNSDKKRDLKMFWESDRNNYLKELLRKEKTDVIHVTHSARMGDIVKSASDLRIPYITTITDYWLLCPTANLIKFNGELCSGAKADPDCLKYCHHGDKNLLDQRWEAVNNFLNKADGIAYAAEFVKAMFEKNGVDTRRWAKIKHGYNTSGERERVRDSNYRFAFTGTLQPSKGAHLTIEAFLTIENPDARLVIYGETKHDEEYSNYCYNLAKGDNRIEFRGRYDHTKLAEEFKDIDCIIVPSNWFEPFPFTLISAVSYGFDVIGASIGGIPEIIGEENSDSLFNPGDSKDLAIKMQKKMDQDIQYSNKIFYEQNIEGEGFKYFQLYKLLSDR